MLRDKLWTIAFFTFFGLFAFGPLIMFTLAMSRDFGFNPIPALIVIIAFFILLLKLFLDKWTGEDDNPKRWP